MAIWNLGSINIDHAYRVPHIPAPGETIMARGLISGLGGKGANMSVAAARAGARCHHIGAIGPEGAWARDRLMEYGVDTRFVAPGDVPTGQAVITLADDGENAITVLPGANHAITEAAIDHALSQAAVGDWLLIQNETNAQAHAARRARDLGLRVAYAAAPFDAQAVQAVLPLTDLLILNAVEMAQLRTALGQGAGDLGLPITIVTRGADGADGYADGAVHHAPAHRVDVVDTTAAGDTFTGYVLAGLDRGFALAQAMGLASRASALKVTRQGAADVIPDLREVEDFAGL